ncbi:MAG TPA: hypothetical protein VFR81_09175 [Longimicrobium sp.]|nr:hypothetical protein [Longimicrobium sp.]
MPYTHEPAASRHGRDRDLLPAGPRPGPYELAYDVRRGYQQPLRPRAAAPREGVIFFRGSDDAGRQDPGSPSPAGAA